MRFEVRDLTVNLLPRHAGEANPTGCTPSPTTGDEDCTPSPPGNCTPSPPNCTPTPQCTPSPTHPGGCEDPSGEQREARRAGQVSLGLLRQQLRQHLSQPGAC